MITAHDFAQKNINVDHPWSKPTPPISEYGVAYFNVSNSGQADDILLEIKISGDIAISIERVLDNSKTYGVEFEDELKRVMVHGLLHIMGYNDKASKDKLVMSEKENKAIKMFHVKQV